jgi:hypothetical protein
LKDEWKEMLAMAGGANVAFYGLDPGGLRGQTIDLHIGPTPWNTTGESVAPGGTREHGKINREFLRDVSENTGGFAVTGDNDPKPGIEQVFVETGSYYLLGFESAFPLGNKVHRLQVRVNRTGVTVHGRTGFSRAAPPRTEPATGKSLLPAAFGGLLPAADIGLRLAAAPFVAGPPEEHTVAVVVGIDEATPARPQATADDLDVVVNAYDADGKAAGSVTTHVKAGLPTGAENVEYEVLVPIRLKPGHYELRVATSSMLTKRSGGLISSVDVPDFARARLSLSGLILAPTSGATATPRDAFSTFLSITPSSRRSFTRDEHVVAMVRPYQPPGVRAQLPALSVHIVDASGSRVFQADVPPGGDVSDRHAGIEYCLILPLSKLSPGLYLLEAVVTRGRETAKRDVRFEVR